MLIMTLYIISIGALSILFGKKNNKLLAILFGIILFIISSLRTQEFGPDVLGYIERYKSFSEDTITYYFNNFINFNGKDPFFYLFSYMIYSLGFSSQLWLSVIALIFCIAITILVYNYSNNSFISFLIIVSLGYFMFTLTGLRQSLAISMIIYSYIFLEKDKKMLFVIFVLLGSLFHTSALVFLLIYPVRNIKVGYVNFIIILISFLIVFLFGLNFLNLLKPIFKLLKYENYLVNPSRLTLSGFVIQFFIFSFCYIYKDNLIKKNNKIIILYNLLFIGLIAQLFSTLIAEFFRIGIYFSIFSVVLIPKVIDSEKNYKIRFLINLLVISVLILYFYWSPDFIDFKFFWQ